jgi:hypothetical protein
MSYNGWRNRQTWNVSMWLSNDYSLYQAAANYMERFPKSPAPYASFIKHMGMQDERTPDGYKWLSATLDYRALNDMMREIF